MRSIGTTRTTPASAAPCPLRIASVIAVPKSRAVPLLTGNNA